MQRWAAKVRLPTEWKEEACWEWIRGKSSARYGVIQVDGHSVPAHRYAYERFVGPVPPGQEIDHLCRNTFCVNPDHLEAVAHRENVRRGVSPAAQNSTRTHCPQGHPYDDDNTGRDMSGGRFCIACRRVRAHAQRQVPGWQKAHNEYLRLRSIVLMTDPEKRERRNAYQREWRAKRMAPCQS